MDKVTSLREDEFQTGVADWMMACFGPEISADQLERADRFCEEALELCQTMPDFTSARAHALVDYVFSRSVGDRHQEVGGVMVTLAALCNTAGLSIKHEATRELERIWTKVDVIRAKQATKPVGSALPMTDARPDGPKAVEMLDEMAACLKLAEERMCYLSGPSSEDEETRIAVMHAREVLQRYKGEGM